MSIHPILRIDLDAVIYNYKLLVRACPDSVVSAVVKDDAYGCNAQVIAKTLYEQANCRSFFVAYASEGVSIRSFVPNADIYVLQGFDAEESHAYTSGNLTPVIACPEQLKMWNDLKPNDLRPAIQVETGLNRLGFSLPQITELSEKERLKFGLVLSHLACADESDSPFNPSQLLRFNNLKHLFPNARFSLAASDGCALGSAYHFDVVRAGAFLYGIHTFPSLKKEQKNVISVSAPLVLFKKLTQSDYVGYGADFHAKDGTKIAVASIGYGDGLFRSFSPKGCVWFQTDHGWIFAPVAGRVSMDNLIIDVTLIPESVLKTAKEVFLLCDKQTVDDLGAVCQTIGYEIASAFGHGTRYRRVYSLKGCCLSAEDILGS